MNSRDRSLEDGPAYSLRHFLAFPSLFRAISTGSISSTVEEVSIVLGDCEDRSKRSTFKGLFRNLQIVCPLMEGWIEYLDEYNHKYL